MEQENTISLEDIQFVINYIDMTVARGACRGEEMLEIGKRREKFVKFLTFAQKQIQEQNNNNNNETINEGNAA